ncbi:MAG: putative amidohydrolase YtcJ [Halioglobus sp.]|jgi:predicted amidohydrolase YtcJ
MLNLKALAPILALTVAIGGCQATSTSTSLPVADLVLKNAEIYTMDTSRSWAQAVAIKAGRIVFVGSNAEAMRYTGSSTQVKDLQGKMILPSFQDVHIHPVSGGVAYSGCPLFDLTTLEQVFEKVTECAQNNPEAPFIKGMGWNWGMFTDSDRPNKHQLDLAEAQRPVILGDSDGHTLWLNSAALALANVSADTVDPKGGEISRASGSTEPNGLLLESAMEIMTAALPPATQAQRDAGLQYAQEYLHSLGITAIQDAYVRLSGNDADVSLQTYRRMQESGNLDLRVVAALYWEPGMGIGQIKKMKEARKAYSKGRLQATAVKFWADGILESYTAKLLEPYSDKPDSDGLLMVTRDEMLTAAPLLDAEGFQIHIHAIGDGTVRYALDALERAKLTNGPRDSRHLTAHTQLIDPADIPRFEQLGVIAGFSPYWAYADAYVRDINGPQIGPRRMKTMYPMKTLIDTGARLAFGSDWSVSTADPLLGIETAVTRQEPDGEPTPVFLPTERISVDQAIAGYTIDAAFANFLDKDTGSVEVGKFADLVILDRNLLKIPVQDISEAKVTTTMIEGKVVYGSY